ncbi:MAG: GNAT family N-acetyltransferase [Solirubrobacteraceae bacterium]
MTEIRITEEPADGADGARLLSAQKQELADRYGELTGPAVTPTPGSQLTVFLVTRDAATGEALGCGALHEHTPEIVEIKRMYVTPAARRRQLGREILRSLEREAALRHFVTVRLEIGDRQPEAEALYAGAGYRAIECWGDYASDPRARCYERDITPAPAD